MINALAIAIALQGNEEDVQTAAHVDVPQPSPPPVLVRQCNSDLNLINNQSNQVSSKETGSNKPPNQQQNKSKSTTKISSNVSLLQISQDVSEALSPKTIDKICIGDKVRITTTNKKTKKQLINVKGTVMYIGYPYIGHGVRYGINLDKAIGEHKGSLMFDVQTGKPVTKSRIKQYVKSIKKRKFFKAKKKHGIFVKKRQIISIDREAASPTRFTINDKVEVKYKGDGYIKFIGIRNLQHSKKDMGIWYGIQLTKRKGINDGTCDDGVRYFQCQPQYGLLCRHGHLILSHNPIDNSNNSRRRPSGQVKPQTSKKWQKILVGHGRKASELTGYNMNMVQQKSAINLAIPNPQKNITIQKSDSVSETYASLIEADHTYQNASKQLANSVKDFNKLLSVSENLPQLAHNLSPNILLKQSIPNPVRLQEHRSFRRGPTPYILPNYHEKYKEKKFSDYYDLNEFEDELGEGEFGVVYKCRKKNDHESSEYEFSSTKQFDGVSDSDSAEYPGHSTDSESGSVVYPGDSISDNEDSKYDETIYAVKKIKKAKFYHLNYKDKQNVIKQLQEEIRLLEKILRLKPKCKKNLEGSNYVIDLVDVFEDRNYLYIVTNFCSGGNLWQYVEQKNGQNYSEYKIQSIMKQILQGLVFLHRNNIAHLDIKPDNIMLNENDEIQLIDFGMSRVIPPLTKAGVLVGTANFLAPEVIEGFYDKKADVWSVGVILFMLRFGYPPFHDSSSQTTNASTLVPNYKNLFSQIQGGFSPIIRSGLGAWFPKEDPVCDELADLISKMLDRNLANRLTAAECLAHPYFSSVANNKKLPLTIMDAFTRFSGQCRFRVMIAKLFIHQIEPSQMKQLRRIWNKFDIDNDGSLTLAQFKKVMNEYEHGYKEYQIEAIFESLDWNETEKINFNSLLTAFSYQRLVAVDERLWEAFASLDIDDDGHITKYEIKTVLSKVNPDALTNLTLQPSLFISDCINEIDCDDDGQVDYQEFLTALHPKFNESIITPRIYATPSLSQQQISRSFVFQQSLQVGNNLDKKYINHQKNNHLDVPKINVDNGAAGVITINRNDKNDKNLPWR